MGQEGVGAAFLFLNSFLGQEQCSLMSPRVCTFYSSRKAPFNTPKASFLVPLSIRTSLHVRLSVYVSVCRSLCMSLCMSLHLYCICMCMLVYACVCMRMHVYPDLRTSDSDWPAPVSASWGRAISYYILYSPMLYFIILYDVI